MAERESDSRSAGADRQQRTVSSESQARPKKAYRKPELSKYEQMHGIGLGS